MSHPTELPHYTLEALAKEIANLRYDALTDFVTHLAIEIDKQSAADAGRGRLGLSSMLKLAAQRLANATEHLYVAWQISKPYELGERSKPDDVG